MKVVLQHSSLTIKTSIAAANREEPPLANKPLSVELCLTQARYPNASLVRHSINCSKNFSLFLKYTIEKRLYVQLCTSDFFSEN